MSAGPARARRAYRRVVAAALAASVLLGAPAAAEARTVTVRVGLPASVVSQFDRYRTDVDAFFPSTVSIRAGDAVRFSFAPLRVLRRIGAPPPQRAPADVGIHTLDLPAKGRRPVSLLIPSGERVFSRDAGGSFFWFRGSSGSILNPKVQVTPRRGVIAYDGTRRVVSGVPRSSRPKSMTVRFRKTGTYRFFCNVHREMTGTVRVLPESDDVPAVAAARRAADAQVKTALKKARALVRTPSRPGTVSVGKVARGGVQRYVFSPSYLSVPRGRTLRFVIPRGSTGVHTATVGPGNPDSDAKSYLRNLAVSIRSAKPDPISTFPSEPPTAGAVSLSPKLHGNGFWNTGVMDAVTDTSAPPDGAVRMSAVGRYTFYCLIHPAMRALVDVR